MTFPPAMACSDDEPMKPADPPVFLFGFERSGTTLLSMIVGAHPSIAVPFSATGLWYRYAARLAHYNCLETRADCQRIIRDLLGEERIGLWDADLAAAVLDGTVQPRSYAAIVARFHSAYASSKGKPRWGNIDIATLEAMEVANRWFPNALFVHIVRDGRDIALSHMTMPYGASNIADCADQWSRKVTLNLKMGAILGPGRYHVIRFEDLVLAPSETLSRLCRFLGIDFAESMLDYARMAAEKVPSGKQWLWPHLQKPLQRERVGVWRRELSPLRRTVFERTAEGLLRELGYDVPPPAGGRLPAVLLEYWYFMDRGDRFRRLARRLGTQRASKLERRGRGLAGPSGR